MQFGRLIIVSVPSTQKMEIQESSFGTLVSVGPTGWLQITEEHLP
jgi:hypothetical protein